jgi:hypothetical protein
MSTSRLCRNLFVRLTIVLGAFVTTVYGNREIQPGRDSIWQPGHCRFRRGLHQPDRLVGQDPHDLGSL